MTTVAQRASSGPLGVALVGIVASLLLAHVVAGQPVRTTMLLVAGVLVVLASFLQPRLVIYLVIFSMLLSPEIGTGLRAGSRAATVRIEDLLLPLVGAAWLVRLAYRKELGLIAESPLNRPIAAYSLVALAATLVSGWTQAIDWTRALLFLAKYIEYFVVYFLVLAHIRDRDDVRSFLAAAFVTCVIVSLVGIAQIPSGERVSAPFEGETGEPNTFGGYLVFMLCLAGGFFFTATAPREKLLWALFGIVAGLPLLYTLSRSSWLAGLVAGVGFLWWAPRRSRVLAVGLSIGILAPILFPEQVFERIEYTLHQPPEEGQIRVGEARLDTSFSARIRSWRHGIEGWSRRPLTGYGVAGFGFMDAQYVRVLTETGLFGLLAFLWLVGATFRMALDRLRNAADRFELALSLGYLCGLVALLVHALGANTFIIVRIMEPFWLVTALVVALPATRER